MTISMRGSWTVSVAGINAAWPQRFRIAGSTNGADNTYSSSSGPVFVTGEQWGITVEHNPTGPISWRQSRYRLANFRVSGGQFLFDIQTDDSGGGDTDFDDLVLTCAMVLSESEYVVYGNVKTYRGHCLFNPCFPLAYYVIDRPWQLRELLRYPDSRRILEKLYPERIKAFERIPVPVPPRPEPDPTPFVPLMIPSGLKGETGLNVASVGRQTAVTHLEKGDKATAVTTAATTAFSLVGESNLKDSLLSLSDLLVLGRLRDRVRLKPCQVKPVGQTIMRFVEYDRTAAEKLGAPYTGEGNRYTLGITATDEFGNYVFRFSQSLSELIDEMGDIAAGEELLTELRPDLIIQIMSALPDGVLYETAPYYNIPNVRRINLCLPEVDLSGPRTSCQGGRAIQALGNLSIVTTGTTLHADGTVSNTVSTGPIVSHAAWYGTVDLYGCFLDTTPAVTHYVLRYRRDGETEWNFVNQEYTHPRKQADGTWKNEKIGPNPVSLRVNGAAQPKQTVGAYLNIEDQISFQDWLNWNRDRKLQINTALYQPVSGAVEFRIEGYDSSGEPVPGGLDTIKLFIDNTWTDGDIDAISLGSVTPEECALFELPSAGAALTIRYRVVKPTGFMLSYALDVYRGSNTHVPTHNMTTGNPVAGAYQAVAPYLYSGTLDETLDPSGYVEVPLEPTAGAWLPTGVNFCAFSFELTAVDRKTNGYGTPGGRTLWRELVGISLTPPMP